MKRVIKSSEERIDYDVVDDIIIEICAELADDYDIEFDPYKRCFVADGTIFKLDYNYERCIDLAKDLFDKQGFYGDVEEGLYEYLDDFLSRRI